MGTLETEPAEDIGKRINIAKTSFPNFSDQSKF